MWFYHEVDAINAIQIILIYHVTPVRTGRITLHPESKQILFTVDIPTLEADSQNISMFELRWRKDEEYDDASYRYDKPKRQERHYPATNKTIFNHQINSHGIPAGFVHCVSPVAEL